MTIYYNKYGGIIHGNPDEYFRLGGKVYIDKYGHFKLKNYIKKKKKEQYEPKKSQFITDRSNLFEMYKYKNDLNLGYSYYITRIKEYEFNNTYNIFE